jgi:hypothetical protein
LCAAVSFFGNKLVTTGEEEHGIPMIRIYMTLSTNHVIME